MYTDHLGTEEYPFVATFYRFAVDESKPLSQQVEEKTITFQTICDVDDNNNGLSNDTITIYYPLDAQNGDVEISIGSTVEVDTYGLVQKGRVLGVRPSQLGGIKVICTRI